MAFIPKNIEEYVTAHSTAESKTLAELNRETHLKTTMPQMVSGHLQGNFIKMMSTMHRPKSVLEIGTFTGYSTICFAEGLAENGVVHTIDINEEMQDFHQKYFKASGFEKQIKTYIGSALEIIPNIEDTFDMVFIDADKVNYLNYYHLVFDKVRKGGFIIADNVLWSGKVTEDKKDKRTTALHEYNQFVQADERVENYLIPIRDGLMVARKL